MTLRGNWAFNSGVIAPSQCFRLILGASSWSEGSGSRETVDFVSGKLRQLLQGKDIDLSTPPHIDVHCSHMPKVMNLFQTNLSRESQPVYIDC
jgi:trafficking protein particle complex subunit 8